MLPRFGTLIYRSVLLLFFFLSTSDRSLQNSEVNIVMILWNVVKEAECVADTCEKSLVTSSFVVDMFVSLQKTEFRCIHSELESIQP